MFPAEYIGADSEKDNWGITNKMKEQLKSTFLLTSWWALHSNLYQPASLQYLMLLISQGFKRHTDSSVNIDFMQLHNIYNSFWYALHLVIKQGSATVSELLTNNNMIGPFVCNLYLFVLIIDCHEC